MALSLQYLFVPNVAPLPLTQNSPFCFSSFLTPDRLEKLNGIEFAWAVRGDTADDAGNSDEPAAGGGTVQAESKEEEGAAKKEEEPKPKAVVKKEDGETSGEKKVETVTV